jgi:hypothetical protein
VSARPTAAMAMHEPPHAVFSPVDVCDTEIVSHNRTSVDRDGRVLVADRVRHVAALLGGRFLEREEIPWYRRPAQYGAVEGELDGLRYQLYLMPWNTEDCGGSAAVYIRSQPGSRLADGKAERKFFTPEQVWHWPDLADRGTLADYVRQATASAAFGGVPPETR